MSMIQGSGMDPFSQALWSSSSSGTISTSAVPGMQMDWKETAEAHVIKADLPGVRKEEVKVELERGGVLVISGERRQELEEQGDTWRQVERSNGKVTRRLQLPENARMEGVKATMENGVLTVMVPKAEAAAPNQPQLESTQMHN